MSVVYGRVDPRREVIIRLTAPQAAALVQVGIWRLRMANCGVERGDLCSAVVALLDVLEQEVIDGS